MTGLKLEVGKYYRTRDGRKVGPMVFSPEYETYAWDDGSETGWTVSGLMSQHGECDGDIIAEWTDAPEVGPVRTVTTTRYEIVPGRYNGIDVGAVNDDGIHIDLQWVRYSSDELTAAIQTLTAIRDAMQANDTD